MKYINLLYNWTISKAQNPKAKWFLAFVSFIESSFFPIPPDVILIPMILSNRNKAWLYSLICTLSSVLGAVLGYLIGFFFFETIGTIIIETYNLISDFNNIKNYYDQYGVWLVLAGGFSPFPYKLITITSGFFNLNLPLFILVSFVARGARFFLIAILLWYYGPKIRLLIEKNLGKFSLLFILLLILGFTLIKLI